MKLLISAYACDPFKGSEAGNGWNWAFLNAKRGNEVWCLTSMRSHASIQRKMNEINVPNLHMVFVRVPKWVDTIYKYGPLLYLSYWIWQYAAYREAAKFQRKVGFDIIQHVTWGSLQMGTFLWKLDVPLIFGPCGGGQFAPKKFRKYFYEYWNTERTRKAVSKFFLLFNPTVKQTLKKAKMVLTTNQETLEMAKNNGAKNVRLFLDTSLPEEFFPEDLPKRPIKKPLKILWVGRLFARKGLPLVLEALSHVDKDIDFELTILGEGPMGKYIDKWIEEYELNGKVKWPGKVLWEEVKEAYKSHDIFMFCSLRDSSAAQLLEAMAYGLPIITLDLHGAHNLVPDDAGIKVNVKDPLYTIDELANAVKILHEEPKKRVEMGMRGFEFAKTQTWPVKTGIVNDFYNEILNFS
jgi:glycosyltransferase involved in cell wall biosynthesis